jgi:hypothetical protein
MRLAPGAFDDVLAGCLPALARSPRHRRRRPNLAGKTEQASNRLGLCGVAAHIHSGRGWSGLAALCVVRPQAARRGSQWGGSRRHGAGRSRFARCPGSARPAAVPVSALVLPPGGHPGTPGAHHGTPDLVTGTAGSRMRSNREQPGTPARVSREVSQLTLLNGGPPLRCSACGGPRSPA